MTGTLNALISTSFLLEMFFQNKFISCLRIVDFAGRRGIKSQNLRKQLNSKYTRDAVCIRTYLHTLERYTSFIE